MSLNLSHHLTVGGGGDPEAEADQGERQMEGVNLHHA